METQSDICCQPFDPVPWDEKTHTWVQKKFIRGYIPQLFHIPLPGVYGKMVGKLWTQAEAASAAPDIKDFLMLAYDPSPWKSELYISVTKEVPGADNVTISGTFVSKVFDGPFNNVPAWIKEFNEYLSTNNQSAKKYYFYYTTCPTCAKKYGHNYVVAFAEV